MTRSTFIFMNQQVIFIKYIFNSTHFCYKLVRKKKFNYNQELKIIFHE
jgi:hypothetical protein